MATWNDGIFRVLTITTSPGMKTMVRISPLRNSPVETREIDIPLETLKEMVNAQ